MVSGGRVSVSRRKTIMRVATSPTEVFVVRDLGGGCQKDHTNKPATLAKTPVEQPVMRSATCGDTQLKPRSQKGQNGKRKARKAQKKRGGLSGRLEMRTN